MLLPPDISREELLSYVRPLYPNGIFPLGAGWRIVFCVVLTVTVMGILIYNSPRLKRRREAFAAFNKVKVSFFSGGDTSALASELSVLMRRVALYRFGREKTAKLNGAEWIDFLARTGADLNEQDRFFLAICAYAPSPADRDFSGGKHLLSSVQKWLERNL